MDRTQRASSRITITTAARITRRGQELRFCGSVLVDADSAKLMDGRRAGMGFADPPYNCRIEGNVSGLGKVRHREFAMASGEMNPEEFRHFLARSAGGMAKHLEDGAVLALCMNWRGLLPLQLAVAEVGLEPLNLAVWVKTNGRMGSLYRSKLWQQDRRPMKAGPIR